MAKARRAIGLLHVELDKQLAGRELLCDRFSVADIGTFIMVATAATLGAPPEPSHAHLGAWLGRVSQRPAVRREMDGMTSFVRGLSRPAAGH